MRKINVCEIDSQINKDVISLDTAMERVYNYIVEQIDPTFPTEEFTEWVNSDEEKPFRWNKKLYHWSN